MDKEQKSLVGFQWKKYLKITAGLFSGYTLWFFFLIIALRWFNPPFTSFTLQEEWQQLEEERYNLRTFWVPYEELPEHLKLAVISSEDQRFFEHWGLDLAAIEEAMEDNEHRSTVRGASTITQQVAKNLFLNSSKTYLRKGIEAGIAVGIETFWSKERILEMYLNTIEFGPGIYGIGKAAKEFFGKEPIRLEPMESAQLAAVLPNPKRMKAAPPSPFVKERRYWILRQMTQISGIVYLPDRETEPDSTFLASQKDTLSGDLKGFTEYKEINLPAPFKDLREDDTVGVSSPPDSL